MNSGSNNNEKAVEVRTHDLANPEAMTDFMMQGWAPSPLTGITAHPSIPYTKSRREKLSKQYVGKTPAYMLDAYGFDESNLDVTVRTDFKINGVLTNEEYVWTVKFTTKFGRKLKEDRYLPGGLDLDKEFVITKRISLEGGEEFNEERTIMDSLTIKSGLIEALDELKGKIMELKPIETLKLANVKKYDITKKVGTQN